MIDDDDDDYSEEAMIQNTCKCGHHTHYNPNNKWSLQDAMEPVFKLFLNKTETVNNWECGLGQNLNTWNANKEKQMRA